MNTFHVKTNCEKKKFELKLTSLPILLFVVFFFADVFVVLVVICCAQLDRLDGFELDERVVNAALDELVALLGALEYAERVVGVDRTAGHLVDLLQKGEGEVEKLELAAALRAVERELDAQSVVVAVVVEAQLVAEEARHRLDLAPHVVVDAVVVAARGKAMQYAGVVRLLLVLGGKAVLEDAAHLLEHSVGYVGRLLEQADLLKVALVLGVLSAARQRLDVQLERVRLVARTPRLLG